MNWTIALLSALLPAFVEAERKPEDMYCGSYSLFVALKAMEIGPKSFEELEAALGKPTAEGYSMATLEQAAQSYGLKTIAVKTSLENLAERPERFACLTIINDHHYVLLYNVEGGKVSVCDPPTTYAVPRQTFESVWSRNALLIGPEAFLSEEAIESRRTWWRRAQHGLIGLGILAAGAVVWKLGRSVHRRYASVAAILAIGLCACGSGCAKHESARATPPNGPRLVVEPPEVDLGRILVTRRHPLVEGRARLRNLGDQPIRIETIVPSCACTDVELEHLTIEPGGSSELTAMIRLANNDDDGATRVVLHTSDPLNPLAEARFIWEASSALHAEVRSVQLDVVRPGDSWHGEYPIHRNGIGLCDACRIEVIGADPRLKCRMISTFQPTPGGHDRREMEEGAPIGRLVLDIEPSEELGHQQSLISLSLECEGEQRALLELPMTWRVESTIRARPEQPFVGESRPGDRLSQRFLVSSSAGRPFSILGVESSDPETLAEVAHGPGPAIVHTVEVALVSPRKDGAWTAELLVRTDDAEDPQLRVPIAGLVDSPLETR